MPPTSATSMNACEAASRPTSNQGIASLSATNIITRNGGKRHQIWPVAVGLFRVVSVTPDAVVLDVNGQHERFSRNCFVLALTTSLPTSLGLSSQIAQATPPALHPPRDISVPHPHCGLSDIPPSSVTSLRGVITRTGILSATRRMAQAAQGAPIALAATSAIK